MMDEQTNSDEYLKDENTYLKMKLMLERGATIQTSADNDLPPEIENQFLKNIVEFEEKFEESRFITVFQKLGSPIHFPPHAQIPDESIEKYSSELKELLCTHNISIDITGTISEREFYRFVTEEVFKFEMLDISIKGFMTGFFYDPDNPDV